MPSEGVRQRHGHHRPGERHGSANPQAVVIPEDEIRFYEETASPLTDWDRDRFLDLLDNPPAANAALKRAI